MVKKNNTRIVVTVSNEMCERLDGYCQKLGLSRSALCAYFIGQAVMGFDKANDIVDDAAKAILQSVKTESRQSKGK